MAQIPLAMPDADRATFQQRREDLQRALAAFKAASTQFNAKAAKDQSDAEFDAISAERARYIEAATQFNSDLAVRLKAIEDSAVAKDIDEQLLRVFGHTSQGTLDNIQKGFEAAGAGDFAAALAMFESAQKNEPANTALGQLVAAAREFTQRMTANAAGKAAAGKMGELEEGVQRWLKELQRAQNGRYQMRSPTSPAVRG